MSELAEAARSFLVASVARIREDLGPDIYSRQNAQWMVAIGATAWESKEFERQALDVWTLDLKFQELLREEFPEQSQLRALLVRSGVRPESVNYSFLVPLFREWLDGAASLDVDNARTNTVIDGFHEAVRGRRVLRLNDAIVNLRGLGRIELEPGLTIRPIQEEELWSSGSLNKPWIVGAFPQGMPSADWSVLELVLTITEDLYDSSVVRSLVKQVNSIRESVLAALSLSVPGWFQAIPLRHFRSLDYGTLSFPDSRRLLSLNRWGPPQAIPEGLGQRLATQWQRFRSVLQSDSHHLRLPAMRFLDGGSREREDDAVVDYCTGLEALLVAEQEDEISYRLALRGATILAAQHDVAGVRKSAEFEALRGLYRARSAIAHGNRRRLKQVDLATCRATGERALREVWWWFFNSDQGDPRQALRQVDERILGVSVTKPISSWIAGELEANEEFLQAKIPEVLAAVSELANDGIDHLKRLAERDGSKPDVEHALSYFVYHVLFVSASSLLPSILAGDTPTCFRTLRYVTESLAKCYFADKWHGDAPTFAARLESLENCLSREHLSVAKLMNLFGHELGLGDLPTKLWNDLSNEWVHPRGPMRRVVTGSIPGWSLALPMRFGVDDSAELEGLGKSIEATRRLVAAVLGPSPPSTAS